jgi:anti-anti-sigma factor
MAHTMPPPATDAEVRARFVQMIPEVHAEGRRTVVALHGEADISTQRVLSDLLGRVIADRTGNVVIDLAGATFIDTAIVRVIATTQQLLHRQDRILTVRSPSRLATRLLQLFVLSDLIETEGKVLR